MKKKIGIFLAALIIAGIGHQLSQANIENELPECAIGSSDDSECVLSPTDCTRGIDEANQSSCQE